MVDANLEISETADKVVHKMEEDTLFNNFDRDPDEQTRFVWTKL